ncbi:hypothetical protein WDZ92_21775 [Nostoc sp. NIES-2111]
MWTKSIWATVLAILIQKIKLPRCVLRCSAGHIACKVLWTEYTYDGLLGRALSVIQANGAGTTTYLYEGNTVKVTSPSGKWKKYEMDGLGRLL